MVILLDTDVMIDVLRQFPPAVGWFNSLDPERVAVTFFTMMELVEGARDQQALRRVNSLLTPVRQYFADEAVQRHALELLGTYRLSHGLGLIDALIAATALRLDVPLYSFNHKHFSVVPRLELREPYAR